jgi:hypothetical protein
MPELLPGGAFNTCLRMFSASSSPMKHQSNRLCVRIDERPSQTFSCSPSTSLKAGFVTAVLRLPPKASSCIASTSIWAERLGSVVSRLSSAVNRHVWSRALSDWMKARSDCLAVMARTTLRKYARTTSAASAAMWCPANLAWNCSNMANRRGDGQLDRSRSTGCCAAKLADSSMYRYGVFIHLLTQSSMNPSKCSLSRARVAEVLTTRARVLGRQSTQRFHSLRSWSNMIDSPIISASNFSVTWTVRRCGVDSLNWSIW